MSVLQLLKPFMGYFPEVVSPDQKINIEVRVKWTVGALLIFLVMQHMPLFGILNSDSADPLYWMRVVLASTRGTLMELGISPIVSASMIMQLFVGLNIIEVDPRSKEDRALYAGAQKLLGLALTLSQAVLYVSNGMYGDPEKLGSGVCILLVVQLFFAGLVVILLDDVLQKGYGIGSAISLFIATNICESIFWSAFSPRTVKVGRGFEFEGAFVALAQALLVGGPHGRFYALKHAFYRGALPNIANLVATAVIFLAVVYFQGFRVELPISRKGDSSSMPPYKIKLFYASNIPIMLQSAVMSNIYLMSQMMYHKNPRSAAVKLLGIWSQEQGRTIPISGFCYYISAPLSFSKLCQDPVHLITYVAFALGTSAFFAYQWIYVSNTAPRDVMQSFTAQGITVKGHRNPQALLDYYIPTAAVLGGLCIGAICVVADLLGAIGSGTGILLAVTIIYQYYETLTKESWFTTMKNSKPKTY